MTKQKYTINSFFAGVGGIDLGFEQTGRFETKYANEFDRNACKTFEANFPNVYLDGQDIHNVSQKEIPDCDIMIGGFPCQAFSVAGYKRGFEDDRGTLFFEMLRMIQAKRPRVIFFENVKNLVTHNDGKTFKVIKEALIKNSYYITWKVMNAKDYGNLPQNRERIYLVCFRNRSDFRRFHFPDPITRTKTLHDIIDFSDQKPEKYYYRQGRQRFYGQLRHDITSHDTAYQWRRQYTRENKSNVLPTLTANMGTGGSNVPLILTSDNQIRKLTPRECFNGQGFPSNFVLPDESGEYQYCYLVTAPDGQQHGTFGEFAFWEMFLKNKIKQLEQQPDKSTPDTTKSDLKSDKSTIKTTKKRKNQVDDLLTRFER